VDRGGALLYLGLWKEGEILFYQETLFIGDSRRYVKEDSGNGSSFLRGPGGLVYWGL
jgi:hypothetical protein